MSLSLAIPANSTNNQATPFQPFDLLSDELILKIVHLVLHRYPGTLAPEYFNRLTACRLSLADAGKLSLLSKRFFAVFQDRTVWQMFSDRRFAKPSQISSEINTQAEFIDQLILEKAAEGATGTRKWVQELKIDGTTKPPLSLAGYFARAYAVFFGLYLLVNAFPNRETTTDIQKITEAMSIALSLVLLPLLAYSFFDKSENYLPNIAEKSSYAKIVSILKARHALGLSPKAEKEEAIRIYRPSQG